MARVKVILEDESGNEVSSNYYDLGTDFKNMDKIEESLVSVSGSMLTDISHQMLALEQEKFLKKVNTKSMADMK